MYEETNTKSNMPAQVELYADGDDDYKFLFIAKGGGSANKSFLFQGDAVDPDARPHAGLPEGEGADARHRGVPAVSPRHRHRRHLGRTDHEDGEARLLPLLRHAADLGLGGRPRLPRSGDGARDVEDDAVARRRRAIRRQVFLPRRAGDPPAAAWRVVADRSGRVVQRRPSGDGQDHQGRRVPGRAGA